MSKPETIDKQCRFYMEKLRSTEFTFVRGLWRPAYVIVVETIGAATGREFDVGVYFEKYKPVKNRYYGFNPAQRVTETLVGKTKERVARIAFYYGLTTVNVYIEPAAQFEKDWESLQVMQSTMKLKKWSL